MLLMNLSLEYSIEMAGTMAFAITAVLSVIVLDIAIFDAVVFAVVTAVGGGTIRDIILDVPVFWLSDLNYIWVAIYSGAIAYVASNQFTSRQMYSFILYLDGLGAALFGIRGVAKAWDLGLGLPIAPIILGVITAIGGGLIRDILAQQKTLLMKREFYAIPVLSGSILFVIILTYLPKYSDFGVIASVLVSFVFRSAAIRWDLKAPNWSKRKPKD